MCLGGPRCRGAGRGRRAPCSDATCRQEDKEESYDACGRRQQESTPGPRGTVERILTNCGRVVLCAGTGHLAICEPSRRCQITVLRTARLGWPESRGGAA